MPISPSGGNWEAPKPVEYSVAAPIVWSLAYDEKCKCFVGKERKHSSTYNQTSNVNSVTILLAVDSRTVSICK